MNSTNRQWKLVSYPTGMPTESNWAMSESPIPEPDSGSMLVRAIYLDVAPYMRGRISPQKNYAAGVSPGELMVGGAIGHVSSRPRGLGGHPSKTSSSTLARSCLRN